MNFSYCFLVYLSRRHKADSNLEPIFKALNGLVKRGLRLRYITEITPDNISYCKEMIKNGHQVRHLDGVKGNFGIADGTEYFAHGVQCEGEPPTQVTVTNVRSFVESQQYFFDTLWTKAISAEERLKGIEEVKPDFIETISDPNKIQKLSFDLVKSAKEEVLIIFSTANAFRRQESAVLLQLLRELTESKDSVRIRILTPIDEQIIQENTIQKKLKENQKIDIRYLEKTSWQTKVTTLTVDRKFSLEVELKDDTKDNPYEAIGMATYSNSMSIVWTQSSIFETLWTQAELHDRKRRDDKHVHSLH
jgi:two-component system, OmpR family, sensor histidine kinase VicK